MEANQNTTMEPYNIEYYIAKYGSVENLTNDYTCAIGYLRMQYKQYEDNPRKGGRYRREKMEHMRQQAKAIFDEFLRVSRAMEEYFATQATETPQISTEAAETVNVSAEGEKAAETQEMPRYECPNYADYAFERGWSIENTDFDAHSGVLCMIHFDPTDEKYVCGCLWQINSDSPNYTEHRRFKTLKGAQNYGTKRMGMKLKYQTLTVHCPIAPIAPTEPPQSPETPQTVDCATDTPKPRETARKRPNRAIGSAQQHQYSALGANGYSVLNDASVNFKTLH